MSRKNTLKGSPGVPCMSWSWTTGLATPRACPCWCRAGLTQQMWRLSAPRRCSGRRWATRTRRSWTNSTARPRRRRPPSAALHRRRRVRNSRPGRDAGTSRACGRLTPQVGHSGTNGHMAALGAAIRAQMATWRACGWAIRAPMVVINRLGWREPGPRAARCRTTARTRRSPRSQGSLCRGSSRRRRPRSGRSAA